MTYTTIEQSKALVNLGLDEKIADMYYQLTEDTVENWEVHLGKMDVQIDALPQIPCWSAEALLEVLPDEVYIDEEEDTGYLTILKEDDTYIVSYDSKERDDIPNYIHSMGDDLADVLFKIVEWLLTNKLI